MKKHLDLFLALVAIVAVGDAASLFGQGTVQQQQQVGGLGFPPQGGSHPTAPSALRQGAQQLQQGVTSLGRNLPGTMDSVFPGGSGGGPGGGVGSSLGTAFGGLGGAGNGGATGGRRREMLEGGIGGGSPIVPPGGPLPGGPAEAPLNRRVGSPTGSGSHPRFSGSGSVTGPERGGLVPSPSLSGGQFGPGVTVGSVAAGGPGSTQPFPSGPGSLFGSGTGPGPSLSGVPGGVSGQALSSSMGRGGLFSPRGTGETGVPGGALSIPNPSSAPRSPFDRGTGTGSSMSGLPGSISGQGLNTPLGSNGPFIPGGGEGSGAAGGLLSTPSLPTGPNASSGSGAAAVTSFPGLPGGVSEPGSPTLPNGGGPRTSGSNGPGGELSSASSIGAGPGAMRGIGRESGLAGPRLTGDNLSGRPGSQRRHRQRKLRPEEAAAVGLGVTSGALALGALAASIISAVNKRQHIKPVIPRRVGPGCLPTRCAGNCGRKRRSIAISKVPAEILDGIPVNFERPY